MVLNDVSCPVCGHKFKSKYNQDQSREIWPECVICKIWSIILPFLACAASIFIILMVIMKSNYQPKLIIGTCGLILDVWGGFLIATGFTEQIYIDELYWRDESVNIHFKKQTRRIRRGLVLLISGFFLQAVSQLI